MATNERSVEDGERSDAAGDRKKGFAEQVAERIIEQLQQGTAPWQKPWKAGQLRMPFNAATQQPYHGVNRLWLASQGYDDPRWMTVRQANSLDASVRRGEKGTMIQFTEFRGEKPMVDEDGRPVLDADGKQKKEVVEYSHPKTRHYYVFNASQIEGLPALEPKQDVAEEWERHQRCENILEASGVSIRHVRGDRAYYRVSTDQITMPERDQFSTADAYYATAMHELGHSTGHPSRLDRGLEDTRNVAKYAKEELRAEIASLMLGERLGIGHDPSQHAAYVGSWIDVLKNDPRELFRAATDAEKITGYVMAIEQKRENDLSHGTSSAEQRATAFEQSIVDQLMNPANDLRSQIASVNRDEVERIAGVVDSMVPFNTANEFWQRHELPHDVQPLENTFDQVEQALEDRHANFAAHELTHHEFRLRATVKFDSENQANKWIVSLPGENPSVSFSWKGTADEAIAEAHHRAVENAVTLNLDPAWQGEKPSLPPRLVLDEYPDIAATLDAGQERGGGALLPVQVDREADMTEKNGRVPLAVPFREKDEAWKAAYEAGFKLQFDRDAKVWTAPEGADLTSLAKWLPENRTVVRERSEPPEQQLATALERIGVVVDRPLVMDGEWHKLPVEGKGPKSQDGRYMIHGENGIPSGWIVNHVTGVKEKWTAKVDPVERISDADRERLSAENAERVAERAAVQQAKHEAVSDRLMSDFANGEFQPADPQHPYLVKKGLAGVAGLALQDKDGKLVLPLGDPDGRIWTVQRIDGNGRKGFEKDGAMAGHHNVTVTGPAAGGLGSAAPIIIAEGWATGESIRRATGATVVTAFTADNLVAVAKIIRERNPDRAILIAGDNDHQTERERDPQTGMPKTNKGKVKAQEAAEAVGGYAAVPSFHPSSKGSDWNDFEQENGQDALKKAMAESMLLADRRQLADAHRTGHDAERVSENVRLHQADAEIGQGTELGASSTELADAKSAFATLRNASEQERDRQDVSDELYNGQPAPPQATPTIEQDEQQPEQEQRPQQKRSSGRSRSR